MKMKTVVENFWFPTYTISSGAQAGSNQLSRRRTGDILEVLRAGDGSLMPGARS